MPAWRDEGGRPPACLLMMAWDEVDVDAAALDALAAQMGRRLRASLGGASTSLAVQLQEAAFQLGRLRMVLAARQAHFATPSWTTHPSPVAPSLAADFAHAAVVGQQQLAACRPAADELVAHWRSMLPAPTSQRLPRKLLAVLGRLQEALEQVGQQAARWTDDEGSYLARQEATDGGQAAVAGPQAAAALGPPRSEPAAAASPAASPVRR